MSETLIAALVQAKSPSRSLDEDIAIATGLWKAWLSKHRYWNFSGPDGASFHWPREPIPLYDAETGKSIGLTDVADHGWADTAELPRWTDSLDDALLLVPKGHMWVVGSTKVIGIEAPHIACVRPGDTDEDSRPVSRGATHAIALCIAALRARAET